DSQAQPPRGGRGQARVVALGGAAGHERRGALLDRSRAQELELADLVPAASEPEPVVALDPQVARAQADPLGQPGRRLERRAPHAQIDTACHRGAQRYTPAPSEATVPSAASPSLPCTSTMCV